MTGEQARWGYENLALDQAKLDALGFAGVMRPVVDLLRRPHGRPWARIHTWDGAKWNFTSDWLQADDQILKPMVKAAADKYAAEKKLDAPHAGGLPELSATALDWPTQAARPSALRGRGAPSGPVQAAAVRRLRVEGRHACRTSCSTSTASRSSTTT